VTFAGVLARLSEPAEAQRMRDDPTTRLPSALIAADWLRAHIPDVRILDVRSAADYERAHIPGAQWVAFDRVLTGTPQPSGARRPLPGAADFAASMKRVGISDASVVVVYDDARGSRAARLWWMLDSLGLSCGVLDGGFASWNDECELGSTRSSLSAPPLSPKTFTARAWPPSHFVDVDELAKKGDSALVLDARSSARFHGELSPLDPRPGHIPKALSAPWTENVSTKDGRLLPLPLLRTQFTSLGLRPDSEALLYCGSGVTACHNALVLRLLGVHPRVYVGSWSEWASDPARPIET
jgi:thiosulfate/3-mercaptopyruvate sulfurtransferase